MHVATVTDGVAAELKKRYKKPSQFAAREVDRALTTLSKIYSRNPMTCIPE